MNKIYYLLLLLSSVGLLNKDGCKQSERFFDTESYHRRTQELKANVQTIDSLSQMVGNTECFDALRKDTLLERYQDFCFYLDIVDFPDKPSISVEECVVKKEVVDLKKLANRKWLNQEFIFLDSLLGVLEQEAKSFKKFLEKDCYKKYNLCQQLKRKEVNKKILKAIESMAILLDADSATLARDSLLILTDLQAFRQLVPAPDASQFYETLLTAMVADVKYQLGRKSNKYLCDDAHIRWAAIELAMILGTNPCEIEHLAELSQDKWSIVIDAAWLQNRIDATRRCAIYPRGCDCRLAQNYDSIAVKNLGSCIGCMDSLALNYCPAAKVQGDFACRYAACLDRCYEERPKAITDLYPEFMKGRDTVLHVDTLCGINRCGCLNPCAENYDPQATIPDVPDSCIGQKCGCLDSTAVNYARRTSPDWARRIYEDPTIVIHDQSQCIYAGCTNPCSLNFDPLAQTSDASCECDSVSLRDLERLKKGLSMDAVDSMYSTTLLQDEFTDYLSKSTKKVSTVNFRRVNLDLIVDVDMRAMKIKSTGEYDGIPLGEYNFKPVNEIMDELIKFLTIKTGDLFAPAALIKIIGEADGHPIGSTGIEFQNAHRSILDEYFKTIAPNTPSDLLSVSAETYDMLPDSIPFNLENGQSIYDNVSLAFLRAYMVKQKIKDLLPQIEEKRIFLGAKANTNRGKQYRRVAVSLQIEGFYEIMGEQEEANLASIAEIDDAIDFFNTKGFPGQGKTYLACPCIDRTTTNAATN
ncbi:MAG: hypothetical protein AAF960_02350 [Bacteroidota bacterium]